jgi:hypothetical protein
VKPPCKLQILGAQTQRPHFCTPFCCSKCHSQGGARLLLLVIVAVFLVAVVLMFARDWGSPAADTSGSGWTVKLKIVITHLQVGACQV